MQLCHKYKNAELKKITEGESTPLERALKMPYNEFLRAIKKNNEDGPKSDFEPIADRFGTTSDEVIKRGQDLHLW